MINENDIPNENTNQFMNFLNNPSEIINSTKFNIFSAAGQFFALIIFAVIGASITFRFENFRDIWNLDYWISVIVLLVEQLYAYQIGYDLGKSMSINANRELKTNNEQIEALIEGVYDNDTEVIRALKKDSAYIDLALNELMDEEKINLVKTRMKEIIEIFKSKLDYFESLDKQKFLFPKKVAISKKQKKRFWRRATAISYCKLQISNGNKMLKDDESILAVPDNNVPGFQRLTYADIVSSQNEKVEGNVSKYYQRSEMQIKAKMFGKKALIKLGLSMIGPAILFGALFENGGAVVYSIFVLVLQFASGFKFGSTMVINVILRNTVNRLKAIKDIQLKIPEIKSKIKKKQDKAEHVAVEENVVEEETVNKNFIPAKIY
jgi:hypothetical protein